MSSRKEWVNFELSLVPDAEGFRQRLERARREWGSSETVGLEAVTPFQLVGKLALLCRHSSAPEKEVIRILLDQYLAELRHVISESPHGFTSAVLQKLDYKIGVPEDLVAELSRLPVQEVPRAFALYEIEDELFGFLESALYVIEGMKLVGQGHEVRAFETRLGNVHRQWALEAAKIAEAFEVEFQGERLHLMESSPPELWWQHLLLEAVRRRRSFR